MDVRQPVGRYLRQVVRIVGNVKRFLVWAWTIVVVVGGPMALLKECPKEQPNQPATRNVDKNKEGGVLIITLEAGVSTTGGEPARGFDVTCISYNRFGRSERVFSETERTHENSWRIPIASTDVRFVCWVRASDPKLVAECRLYALGRDLWADKVEIGEVMCETLVSTRLK